MKEGTGPVTAKIRKFLDAQAGREFTTEDAKRALPEVNWASLRSRIHGMWAHNKLERRPKPNGGAGHYLYREREPRVAEEKPPAPLK